MGATYLLKHPLELKNTAGETLETITEITLHRLNGKAMRDIGNARDKGSGEVLTVMVCTSARIPRSTFDQLDAEDTTAMGEVVAGFIGGAPATGSS